MSSYVNPTWAGLTLHSAFPVRFPLTLNYRSGLSKHPDYIPGSDSAGSREIRQNGCCIKFASAINPDIGIFSGRSAQEEALCRCSPLSLCLLKDRKV